MDTGINNAAPACIDGVNLIIILGELLKEVLSALIILCLFH